MRNNQQFLFSRGLSYYQRVNAIIFPNDIFIYDSEKSAIEVLNILLLGGIAWMLKKTNCLVSRRTVPGHQEWGAKTEAYACSSPFV